MTPEERIRAVSTTLPLWQVAIIANAIHEAIAEEREACAKLSETIGNGWPMRGKSASREIAAAIRARSNMETA